MVLQLKVKPVLLVLNQTKGNHRNKRLYMKLFIKVWKPLLISAFLLFTGCSISDYPSDITPVQQIENFKLGHLVVKAENTQKGFFSRNASEEILESTLKKKLLNSLSKQNGSHFFHISVVVSGYVLAKPGLPIILSPKSVLILDVFIFDDESEQKVFNKPKRFSIFESLNGNTIIGSGLTLTAEEQLDNLTTIATYKISQWLVSNKDVFE